MRKLLLILIVSVFTLIVFSPQLYARGPADKATGDVILENDLGEQVALALNAHEAKDNRPAKGMVIFEGITNPESFWEIEVSCVTVLSETEAYFGGQVLDSGDPGVSVGDYIMLRVIDNGEPGVLVDEVYYGMTSVEAEFNAFCAEPLPEDTPEGWGEVIEGNVQVHFYGAPGPPGNFPSGEYRSLGQCISAQKSENCAGLRGRDRAACNQEVREYCQELFGIPSNQN